MTRHKKAPPKKAPPECQLFPPWFVPKKVLDEVQRLLPSMYHQRFLTFFNLYGCIRCGKKRPYGCNGLCYNCVWWVQTRLRRCDSILAEKYHEPRIVKADKLMHRINSARDLLADLVSHIPRSRSDEFYSEQYPVERFVTKIDPPCHRKARSW